ncbi:MAG TPA: hypothetical protein VMW09_06850 [Desulfatiglandales bacterium]|nr:hypothetical protein [Desulfatiglandales bacterium]
MSTISTIDFDHAVKEVLASGGQVSFKYSYRIDVVNYSWVKDYVRDQKLRQEIDQLKKKIAEAQNSPIDKNELRAMFEAGVEQTRQNFLELLKNNFSKAQKRECGVIGGLHEYGNIASELPLMSVTLVSSEDIKDIIAALPVGIKQKEIEKTIEGIKKQIAEREAIIEKELSPKDRWFYDDRGNPRPYPNDRWSKFVDGWRKVVARFDGKVDIEGFALVTEDEFAAFHMLELEKVFKLTPLRAPWER